MQEGFSMNISRGLSKDPNNIGSSVTNHSLLKLGFNIQKLIGAI